MRIQRNRADLDRETRRAIRTTIASHNSRADASLTDSFLSLSLTHTHTLLRSLSFSSRQHTRAPIRRVLSRFCSIRSVCSPRAVPFTSPRLPTSAFRRADEQQLSVLAVIDASRNGPPREPPEVGRELDGDVQRARTATHSAHAPSTVHRAETRLRGIDRHSVYNSRYPHSPRHLAVRFRGSRDA